MGFCNRRSNRKPAKRVPRKLRSGCTTPCCCGTPPTRVSSHAEPGSGVSAERLANLLYDRPQPNGLALCRYARSKGNAVCDRQQAGGDKRASGPERQVSSSISTPLRENHSYAMHIRALSAVMTESIKMSVHTRYGSSLRESRRFGRWCIRFRREVCSPSCHPLQMDCQTAVRPGRR